jgi:hypothetical protein
MYAAQNLSRPDTGHFMRNRLPTQGEAQDSVVDETRFPSSAYPEETHMDEKRASRTVAKPQPVIHVSEMPTFTGVNRTYADKGAFSICFSLSVSDSCSRRF